MVVEGAFESINEGNFALHFMCAFLGKASITGRYHVHCDGQTLVQESFQISKTFAAFSGPKTQLKGDIKFLAGDIVKKTLKACKTLA